MTLVRLWTFLLFSLSCKIGFGHQKDSIIFCVTTSIVHAKLDAGSFVIPVSLENRSKTNRLLYAFVKASILDSSMDSIFFNDVIKNGGAGTLAIVLDMTGKRQEVFFDIVADGDEQKGDLGQPDLAAVQQLGKSSYINGAVLIRGTERRNIKLVIPMNNVILAKGEYQLKLLYYAGKELPDVVGPTQLREVEKSKSASTFFGSLESNTIRLIVE